VFEACRVGRLTRNQHVLLRLGELAAYVEAAAALARRAAAAEAGQLPEKADRRFDASALAALSRVFAREAALKAGEEGVRWVCGAADPATTAQLLAGLPLDDVRASQAGLLADMDTVADVLYDRAHL
jgi:alkylation response protein AidB-like acyl-CoA dehydrogenase